MITTTSQLIYSIAATRRIFNVANEITVKVKEFHKVMWVHVQGCRPRFVSKAVYRQHFADWRKEQSKGLIARSQGDYWVVYNPQKQSSYCVETFSNRLECSCDDYANQFQILKKGCCKHCYAVLAQLGFTSLRDYMQAQ